MPKLGRRKAPSSNGCAGAGRVLARVAQTSGLLVATSLLIGAARNIVVFGLIAVSIVSASVSRAYPWFAPSRPAAPSRGDRLANVALPAMTLTLSLVLAALLVRAAPKNDAAKLGGRADPCPQTVQRASVRRDGRS
jgi:hypothetical protein